MYKLYLPTISPETSNEIIGKLEFLYKTNKDNSTFILPWNYREGANIALFLNFPQCSGIFPEVDAILDSMPWPMCYSLSVIANQNPNSTAYIVPHYDRKRNVAFNFLLEPGGSQVETWFIAPTEEQRDQQAIHDSFEISESYIQEANNWCLFDTARLHGVSNIETTRFIISATTIDRSITLSEIVNQLGNLTTSIKPDTTVKRL
jgi:hypothetical protein